MKVKKKQLTYIAVAILLALGVAFYGVDTQQLRGYTSINSSSSQESYEELQQKHATQLKEYISLQDDNSKKAQIKRKAIKKQIIKIEKKLKKLGDKKAAPNLPTQQDQQDQPAQVTATDLDTPDVAVETRGLSVVPHDAAFDKFGKNISNLILGHVDISSNTGEAIELKNINLSITGTGDIDTVFDINSVEAVTANGAYNLVVSNDTDGDNDCTDVDDADCTFSSPRLDLNITGTQRVWFRVDTIDEDFIADVDINVSLRSMAGDDPDVDGLYFEELNNRNAVTDIAPGSITFDDITSQTSSAVTR
ncbi:hypothetical protein HOH51_00645 [bacterium]|jgi:hypothetical protein|nr:hypothetical protein [bacterium]